MELTRQPVEIRSHDGLGGGVGAVEFAQPPLLRRLWKAGLLLLVGLVVGTLLLPVPLIHLAGVMFFLAMFILAVRRLFARRVLKTAHGRCPSCQAEGSFFVGFGGRRLTFPISTACPNCRVSLDLLATPAAGQVGGRPGDR